MIMSLMYNVLNITHHRLLISREHKISLESQLYLAVFAIKMYDWLCSHLIYLSWKLLTHDKVIYKNLTLEKA